MIEICSPQKGISFPRVLGKTRLVACFCTIVILFSSPAIAQENESPGSRPLSDSISQLFPDILKKPIINFPPSKESLLGAIVSFDSTGRISVVSRLSPGSYESGITRSPGSKISDDLSVYPKSTIVSECLNVDEEIRKSVKISITVENIESRSINRKNKKSLDQAIGNALQPKEVIEENVKLYLVTAVYRGYVRVQMDFQDSFGDHITTRLDDFDFKRVRPGMGAFLIESNDSIEFAFQADLLELRRGTAPEPQGWLGTISANVDDKPPANGWNRRMCAASMDESHEVTVFYASDRKERAKGKKASPKFWGYFLEFFIQGDFWIVLGVVSLFVVLIWILLGYFRTWKMKMWLITGVGIILLLLILSATSAGIYARQEMNKNLDSEMTADRGELTYGTCKVSVPKNHRTGEMERPSYFLSIDIEPENVSKHVVFLKRARATEEQFLADLKHSLKDSKKKECFVFVHGFNVTFKEAARRTAQLWYDLQPFSGAPIFYSWPSKGNTLAYTRDETEAAWTETHFESFLRTLAKKSSAQRIHIIAHSMGNRIVTNVLAKIARSGDLDSQPCIFSEIILAAPDIDADTFKDEIAPRFTKRTPHVTMYCSANDEALAFSITVNGYRRVGHVKDGEITVVDGIDTINVSPLDTSFDTHSYMAAHRSVISDLHQIIVNGLPPSKRSGLNEVKKGTDRYWIFRP